MNQLEEITKWLQQKSINMGMNATIYPEFARTEDEWLHIPVRIEGGWKPLNE